MSHFASHHSVFQWEGTGKSSQGLENNGANSMLTLKAFYPEGIHSKQLHKQDRIVGMCQGDMARLIQDFQGLSPDSLKDCGLGDLLSEVPREECSSLDKPKWPMRFGWSVLHVKEGDLRVAGSLM